MSYQKLELNKNRIVVTKPRVTMRKRGIFYVNSIARKELLKDTRRVYLLWDSENRKIGFRPTDRKKNSFSVSKTRGRRDANIAAQSLLRYYGINISVGEIFTPVWNEEENLAEIKLNKVSLT